MKKPLPEEKTDLKQELKILSLFLVFISSSVSFTQIPVNGFCKLSMVRVDPGFNSLSAFNFNKDSYSDLILFNTQNKQAAVLAGYGLGEFREQRKINLPMPLTNLEPVYNRFNEIENYAFTSRMERTFGLFSFTTTGSPTIVLKHKFNTYPDKISIADINGNNKNEYLISGSGFDGLSVLAIRNNNFIEDKLMSNMSFSSAHFVDLNNDGIKDIAAYNLLSGTIHFFYNNGTGVFKEIRKIPSYTTISQFKTFDVNSDTYYDLIISSRNSLKIFYGDFRSSYDSTITINTAYSIDDFVIGDFNRDGYFDIVYLSKESGVISTLFGKADGTFHNELFHIKRDRIESISLYISKFVYGVVYITGKGEAGLISRLNSVTGNFDLAVSPAPASIAYFDNEKNDIADLAFLDRSGNSLNILLRNKEGIPDRLYSSPLFGDHHYIEVNDSEFHTKSFYCYSFGSKLIEMRTFDFKKAEIQREQLYVPGGLIAVRPHTHNDIEIIYTVYKKANELHLGVFRKQDSQYLFSDYKLFNSNWKSAEIIPFDKPVIYSWVEEKENLILIQTTVNSGSPVRKKIQTVPVPNAEVLTVSKAGTTKDSYRIVSFIQAGEKKYISIVTEKTERLIDADKHFSDLRIENKKHLSFGHGNSVFFYDEIRKSIRRAEVSSDSSKLNIQEVFRNISAEDFIIKNLDFRNIHLIYSDNEKGSISIKQLP